VTGRHLQVDVRVDHAFLQLQSHFQQAAHPGRGFHVPDVRLDRADDDRLLPV
jgi:hypothetical protein